MKPSDCQPVLILGAGVNGTAVARELALNGVPVWVVDANDIAFGATSKSSRLIHGGLRYLEYGDFRLVRESLLERNRLRRLAPQFVESLPLFIPVSHLRGGMFRSALRFLGSTRWKGLGWLNRFMAGYVPRGLLTVRLGLRFYDLVAGNKDFPRSRVYRVGVPGVPQVDSSRFRWLCAYSDGQVRLSERWVIAQLEDARELAAEQRIDFRVLTHHRAQLSGRRVEIRPANGAADGTVQVLEPSAIVNATGAWGDYTLAEMRVPSDKLFGGTKGSHIITHQRALCEALGDAGVYAEASDGRLVFVLPFGDCALIGTTDLDFSDRPDRAAASQAEVDYLIQLVNELFPQIKLTSGDVDVHYSGIRPLPPSSAATTAAISRDHAIVEHEDTEVPFFTLVGGKLTTARAFGEQVADTVLSKIGKPRIANTRDRPYPGARDYPRDRDALRARCEKIASDTGFSARQVSRVWTLCGSRAEEILEQLGGGGTESLSGTDVPIAFARWVIANEWATTVSDLVERRLMLFYEPGLSVGCLRELGGLLAEGGLIASAEVDASVAAAVERLHEFYGKRVVGSEASAGRHEVAPLQTG